MFDALARLGLFDHTCAAGLRGRCGAGTATSPLLLSTGATLVCRGVPLQLLKVLRSGIITGAKTENALGLCCGLCSPARVPVAALVVVALGSTVLDAWADGAAAVAIVVAVVDAKAAADEVLFTLLLLLV